MNSKKVVETFNENGEPEQFRAFSSRLQEFIEKFPTSAGYRMVVTATDSLSSMPGLATLYRTAIEAGKNPVELGLPAVKELANKVIFRAELFNKEDKVVSSASTYCVIDGADKTWEVMETNARSRLMASLGIGYELLDADENLHVQQMSKNDDVPTLSIVNSEKATQRESAPAQETVEQKESPIKTSVPEVEQSTAPAIETESEFPFAEHAKETISVAILRQIKTMALNKGLQINPVTTNDEARAERKRIMSA